VALAQALAVLRDGGVVAYPTETFYGLAVDALDDTALQRLLQLKGRSAEKTVSLIVSGRKMLETVCAEVPPLAERLMADHWPGALTLALPARPGLPEALVSDGCVAVRQSPHPLASALVTAFGRPISATSANRGGEPPTRTAAEVRAAFAGSGPDDLFVLDGGQTPGGAPSTLVRVRGGTLEVLRRGAVSID
jgi:L-threonylcarbamoyladenylate synthase